MNTLLLIFINFSILVIAYVISLAILNCHAKKYNSSLASLLNMDYNPAVWTNCNNLSLAFNGLNLTVTGCTVITVVMLILIHNGSGISTSDTIFLTVIPSLTGIGILNTIFTTDGVQEINKIYKKLHKQLIKF